MKTLAARIWDVRSWIAPIVRDVPSGSSYLMELDAIAHELQTAEPCPHGRRKVSCRRCWAEAFSKERAMGMPVTQNFDLVEFECRDGSSYPVGELDDYTADGRTWLETRLRPLCETLEIVRAAAGGGTLHIDSGYRTIAYDEQLYEASAKDGMVAPASRSQHPKGRAADVTHATLRPLDLFNLVMQLYGDGKLPRLGGCGLYRNFVHLDIRPRMNDHLAIWGGTRPSNIA
jgi:uncharacterized protein YcbK (DUF882 family)